MIKASLLYPTGNDRFDFDYWTQQHLPFVKASLGPALTGLAAERGLLGGGPGTPPPYTASGHLYFETLETMQAAYEPVAAAIRDDIPNFTDAEPLMIISQVLDVEAR